ncbi:putative encoded peptide [Medicago truncatula]|uniref:Putative encoded peptide n=1 Tax=Medicago truncatula TaxID=3880 RepID=G7ZY37_MEDTR|nr:unknown [Medicago truncatula]RHN42246.1 putative encoded peptide [Medicago truncatula]
MAHLARICLFYVLLFLSHELLLTTTEGRSLRQSIQPPNIASTKMMSTSQLYHRSNRSLEGDVEAFRPTTPGHSPGIGHSINN